MAIYSAYLKQTDGSEFNDPYFRLIPDGKAIFALLFPPFWLIQKRLWMELLIYAIVAIGIAVIGSVQPSTALMYLSALPGLYLLLEGNQLICRKLERDGWTFAGVYDADNWENAEIKFIAENKQLFEEKREVATKESLVKNIKTSNTTRAVPPLGLFPE